MNSKPMNKDIIDKVLSKTATPQEAKDVAAWFATNEGQEYLSVRYDREVYFLNENTINAWLDHNIPEKYMKERFINRIKLKIRSLRFRFAAAVLIPIILFGSTLIFIAERTQIFSKGELAQVNVPYGEQLQIILQDGTSVKLNSGSSFLYPSTFGLFNRKVKLIGEGYFSVAKDNNRPFIVELEDINVRVTGTIFNIKAYSGENIVIALEEGSVEVSDVEKNIHLLKKGDFGSYSKTSKEFSIGSINEISEYTSWVNNSIYFYRRPLNEILKTIERLNNVHFEINDTSLLNYKFSISSNNTNVNSILEDLEKVSNIRFHEKGEKKYLVTSSK